MMMLECANVQNFKYLNSAQFTSDFVSNSEVWKVFENLNNF